MTDLSSPQTLFEVEAFMVFRGTAFAGSDKPPTLAVHLWGRERDKKSQEPMWGGELRGITIKLDGAENIRQFGSDILGDFPEPHFPPPQAVKP